MEKIRSPFAIETKNLWVALKGTRNGYIQLAPSSCVERFELLSPEIFNVAQAWAVALEKLEAERVLWLTLAEVVHHKHIHLYPRWPADELIGIPLFEARDTQPQPAWTPECLEALNSWAKQFQVCLI